MKHLFGQALMLALRQNGKRGPRQIVGAKLPDVDRCAASASSDWSDPDPAIHVSRAVSPNRTLIHLHREAAKRHGPDAH
jgi:hypothetical protein